MMRLPAFRFLAAHSLGDAVEALSDDPGGTRLVAGGTDLWPNMKRRHQQARRVVALRRVEELHGISDGGETRIGAMTTLAEICRSSELRDRHPGLVRAVASISTPVLRNMGTLGGNLCLDTRCTYYNQNEEWRRAIGYCLKEQGETCWVAPSSSRCYAISAADSVPVLCAVGARVRLVSREGERTIPLARLYRDDGIQCLTKRPDEVLVEVLVPCSPRVRSTYWKLRRRGSVDFPVLGVGAALTQDEKGRVTRARIYLGGLTSRPLEVVEAQTALEGKVPGEGEVRRAGELARGCAPAFDNTDFHLRWRRQMVQLYVEGALRELAGLPRRAVPPPHGAWAFPV